MNLNERANDMKNFFNEKIDTYDATHEKFMESKKLVADNLPSNTNTILDLGCGTGLELFEVIKKCPNSKITGIDVSDSMLKELEKRPFSNQVTTICGDFFEVEFGTNYDSVISTSALHHFYEEDKRKLYQKIYDSLKENGTFINCDKIALSIEEQEEAKYNYEYKRNEFKHLDTPLTEENETKLLKEVGFKKIEIKDGGKDNYRLIIATK